MKKILIFSLAYYPSFIGGAEVAIKEITDRIPKQEYQFDMITLRLDKNLPKFEKIGNVNVYRIGFVGEVKNSSDSLRFPLHYNKYLLPFLAFFKAMQLHREKHYDVTWAMMATYSAFGALFFKFRYPQIPFLLSLQEGDPFEYIKKRVGIFYPLFKRIFIRADSIQTISHYLAGFARDMGFTGEVKVVPNGVDLAHFQSPMMDFELTNLKDRLAIKYTDTVLITTSRLVVKNAVGDIIKAIALLPDSLKNQIKFLILGQGYQEQELKKLVALKGLSKQVFFLGFVAHSEMPKYLKISNIFIRPSLSEGFGNSFIEAMACGVPVIATPVGGIVDFLKDRETGIFCKVSDPKSIADAITTLLNDKKLRDHIIQNALIMVKKDYDWNKIAVDIEGIFVEDALRQRASSTKMPSVKLLIATGIYPPDIGGPATYSKLLFDELPKKGIDVEVINFGKFIHFSKGIRHFRYFFEIMKRAFHADIIFAQDPVSVGLPTYFACLFSRKPFLLKIVGDYAWEQGKQRFGITDSLDVFSLKDNTNSDYVWFIRFLKKVESFVASRAAIIIVPSNYLKNIVSNWGIDPAKIRVVYNSFEAPTMSITKEQARKNLDLQGHVIFSAGRLVSWKGFISLIDIMPNLMIKYPSLTLIIAGEGPERKKIEQKIVQLKMEERVILIGKLPQTTILQYLKASDVFVLNTGYEGFSHFILEAMAMGAPLITTSVGGNVEIVSDHVNGLLVGYDNTIEIQNAIETLLSDRKLARRLALTAQKNAGEFTKERMLLGLIMQLERLYPVKNYK
jgi:glycosyltransferase involved in cell wall biosynthesis